MAEIRLITILPTQAPGSVTQPQNTTSQAPGIQINLPSGSILSGFIVNRDPTGNPVLRTDKGDVVFQSDFFLKIGAEVVIRIENRVGNSLAHILSVNGQPPAVAEAQSSFAETPEVIVSSNLPQNTQNTGKAAPTPAQAQAQPTAVTGTLITPAPQEDGTPSTLPQGSNVTLKIVTVTQPNAQPATTTATPANPTQYAAYARTAGNTQPQPVTTTPTPVTPPTTTTTTTPQVTAATPATATAPAAATTTLPQPGQVITATVTATEPTGETLVQTPIGLVRLQPGTTLPVGSQVTFEIASLTPPVPGQVTAAQTLPTAPLTELAQQWQSLQQIFTLLGGRLPVAGGIPSGFEMLAGNAPWIARTANAQNATPQTISTGLMMFIAALRGGDFKNWLGAGNTEWLEELGHGPLLKKAEGEFLSIARQFNEPVTPQHWQTLFFPVAVEGEWQQARLFVKRDRKQPPPGSKQKPEDDTRFVIEADLSQMGEIQLDGFVRQQEKNVEFDLFIRTQKPFENATQQDIFKIYNDIGELTGYKGNLLFQTVKEFPVNPMKEVMAQTLGNVVA